MQNKRLLIIAKLLQFNINKGIKVKNQRDVMERKDEVKY